MGIKIEGNTVNGSKATKVVLNDKEYCGEHIVADDGKVTVDGEDKGGLYESDKKGGRDGKNDNG